MNAEKQIIGSLLLDASRIDDMHLINSEMFVDGTLGMIFSIYEHADGKEINQLTIIPKLITSYRTRQMVVEMLADIASSHDPGVSDKYCEEAIFDEYRVRKFNELLSHVRLSPQNIDNTFDDIKKTIDVLQKNDSADAKSISELTEYSSEYFVEKNRKHFDTGFQKIDKAIGGIDDGDVIIIAARPGVGKSAFALQMIRKFGRDGYKVGYFNLEMSNKQIYERSVSSASGLDMTRIRLATNFLNDEREKFMQGNEQLKNEKNVFVITGTQSINSLRATQKRDKYQIIVVDYLQLIQSTGKRNNRVSEVGDISRGLKAIATDFQIPVVALSQLNRASEMNKDKEPAMSELRESGDIEQDASVILMIWNPNKEDESEKKIKVEKSRNGYTDRETLYFDGKHMTFSTVDGSFRKATQDEELQWS